MNIYILGGGCFGSQYVRWLLLARERGKINFEVLTVIDKDKRCRISKQWLSLRALRLVSAHPESFDLPTVHRSNLRLEVSDWVEFLVSYVKGARKNSSDLIVSSHAAPHLLGKAFFNLIESMVLKCPLPLRERPALSEVKGVGVRGNVSVSMTDIPSLIGTPFEKRLEKGVVAASMATWECPANCTEPKICPHTHTTRHWDLEAILKDWAKSNGIDAFYLFPARHFAYAVSAIPADTIIAAWRSLKKKLKENKEMTVGVATSSACHGIVSGFHVQTSVK